MEEKKVNPSVVTNKGVDSTDKESGERKTGASLNLCIIKGKILQSYRTSIGTWEMNYERKMRSRT
jgi:hypothetical protein